MMIVIYIIIVLSYKLITFGIPLDRPSNFMCDNQGLVNKTILSQSTLGKKQNLVNYHVVCKAAAAVILRVGNEYTDTTLDDLPG